jgi:uncharacterized protein YkwD
MFVYLNWVDWTIVAVFVYYAIAGWGAGFADLGLSLVTFLISLWLSIKFHAPVGDFLSQKFGFPIMWTDVLGYIIVAFIAQALLSELVHMILVRLPKKVISSKLNKWLGLGVSLCNSIVIVAFFLLVILALPIRGTIKIDVQNSVIGNFIVVAAQKYGGPVNSTIDQARDQVLNFVTVEPDSSERVSLPVYPTQDELAVDPSDEQKMLDLVNQERTKAGVGKLTVDATITTVARAHSRDMFMRKYFAHVNPEGQTAGDRLEKAGISYTLAGENIAYAPDLATAHTGLMNSPGHRANILDPAFHRVGIGIISTNTWGMMFTQDFAN